MSTTARWTVGVAGFLFAVSGFLPFTASAHVWTAIVLGAIVGAVGFAAARTASWAGALTAFVGFWTGKVKRTRQIFGVRSGFIPPVTAPRSS